MKPNKHEIKQKKFLKTAERINELHSLLWKQEKIKLEKPIFVGHWRFFVVRADVLKSSIGENVQKIVDATNTWVLGKKNDEKSYNTSHDVISLYNDDVFTVSGQGLKNLPEKQAKKLFSDDFLQKWFLKHVRYFSVGTKNLEIVSYFPKIRPHMIEYGYKKAYIEEVREASGDVMAELDFLNDFMTQNDGWKKVYNESYCEWSLSLNKKQKLKKIHTKELQEEYLA